MSEIITALSKGWTPGGVGIYLIWFTVLGAMWKGLPAVLDAWSNSVARERKDRQEEIAAQNAKYEREIGRLEGQNERLENLIVAGDKRHEECVEGQSRLRAQIAAQDETISKLVITIRQMQLRATENGSDTPATMTSLIARLS